MKINKRTAFKAIGFVGLAIQAAAWFFEHIIWSFGNGMAAFDGIAVSGIASIMPPVFINLCWVALIVSFGMMFIDAMTRFRLAYKLSVTALQVAFGGITALAAYQAAVGFGSITRPVIYSALLIAVGYSLHVEWVSPPGSLASSATNIDSETPT